MSNESIRTEAKETDALNVKKKQNSPKEDDVIIALSSNTINRNLSWKHALRQGLACLISLTLVIPAGINMAYSAILLPQLFEEKSDITITLPESTWIASIVTLGLLPGALAVGPLMDKFGRKKICLFTCVPFMIAWLVQCYSTKVWHIYVSRALAGIAAGLSTVSTVYVSEITHPNFRPMLLGLNSVFVSFGVLLTCVFGVLLSWRTLAMINFGISAASLFALLFVPESPYWSIVFQDDSAKAANSYKWIYPNQKVYEEQYQIFMESRSRTTTNKPEDETNRFFSIGKIKEYLATYLEPDIYKPLIILLVLFTFQQFTGAYAIIFYAVEIFQKIGSESKTSITPYQALVFFGAIRFVMSIISAFLAKKFGRRALLMTSGIGMSLTILMAGSYMYFTTENEELAKSNVVKDREEDNMTLICLLGYVCFSAVGFLVIPWTLIGELLPVKVRGVLSGVLVAIAYVLMFGIVKVFPYMLESLNIQIIFFGAGIVNLLAVCFIFFFLPETFGKTFMEIERYFKK